VDVVSALLKPYDGRPMRSYPVSNRINHVGNDDCECCAPMQLTETQNQLFS
jgi:putative SOS response-associated peptidase YedK